MKKCIFLLSCAILVFLPRAFLSAALSPKTLFLDTLIRGSRSTVYYYASDGFRYVFPNEKTFSSWFRDFSQIITLSDEELATIPLRGNVTYRPGVRLVKFQTEPRVYAVQKNGMLRWVETEELAQELYGKDWNKTIDDIPDAFFTNYNFGESIKKSNDYLPQDIASETPTINEHLGIPKSEHAPKSDTRPEWKTFPPEPTTPLPEPIPPVILPLGAPPTATSTATSTVPLAPSPIIPPTTTPPPTPQAPLAPPAPPITVPVITSTTTPAAPSVQQDTTAPIISNVTVVTLTQNSATITWITSETAYSQVSWGATSLYGNNTDITNQLVYQHVVQIPNLSPGTTYHFKVKSKDPAGNVGESSDQTFTTSSPSPASTAKVKLAFPNGGETLLQGNNYDIQWDNPFTAGFPGDKNMSWWVTILRTNGGSSQGGVPIASSSYKWYYVGGNSTGNDYKIRITLKPNCIWSNAPCPDPSTLLSRENLLPTWEYGDESDAAFSIVAPSDTTPPVIANFFIAATNITQTSAIINWTTNEEIKPIDNWVYWGTTADYGNITPYSPDPADPDFTKDHSIYLSGLTSNTVYHFKVKSTDLAGNTSFSNDHAFTTLPAGQVLGESYSEINPLGLALGDLIENLKTSEMFYADSALCLHWVPTSTVAIKNFGTEWKKLVKSFYGIPQGYNFCENMR